MSIGYKTPAVVHLEQGEQRKAWKNKIYPQKQTGFEKIDMESNANLQCVCSEYILYYSVIYIQSKRII